MTTIVARIIAVDLSGELDCFLGLGVINGGVVTNLIIVGGSEGTRISRTISLQLSVNFDFAVAGLLYVARSRLFIDEADYACVHAHVRVKL